MHCSSFEPLLDAHLSGGLSRRERARVERHLAGCAACESLLAEIRVIDALLVTPSVSELAPNFSFAVMAELRDLPVPHVHRTPILRVLGAYLVVAWVALGGFLASGSPLARESVALYRGTFGQAADVFTTLAAAVGRLCDHNVVGVGATMGAILVFDASLAVAAVAAYRSYLHRAARGRLGTSQGFEA